jgi:hypothetical protein
MLFNHHMDTSVLVGRAIPNPLFVPIMVHIQCQSPSGSWQDHSLRGSRLASQHLTKSRYIAGLQCLRRLWLLVHEPPPYEEPAPGSPMDIGRESGRKAHLLFPVGTLIDEEPYQITCQSSFTSASSRAGTSRSVGLSHEQRK